MGRKLKLVKFQRLKRSSSLYFRWWCHTEAATFLNKGHSCTQSPLVSVAHRADTKPSGSSPGLGTLLSILASSWNWIRNSLCTPVTSHSDQAEGRLQSALEKENVLFKFKHSRGQVTGKGRNRFAQAKRPPAPLSLRHEGARPWKLSNQGGNWGR